MAYAARMARRKRAAGHRADAKPAGDQSVDVADLGRQVGVFETNNGLAHGIIGTAAVVLAVLILRPVARAFKALLRG